MRRVLTSLATLALLGLPGVSTAGSLPCEPLPFEAEFCSAETPLKPIMHLQNGEGYIYALPSDYPAVIEVSVMVKSFLDWENTPPEKLDDLLNQLGAQMAGVTVEDITFLMEDSPTIAGLASARSVYLDPETNGNSTLARSLVVAPGYALIVQSTEQGQVFSSEHKDLHQQVLANLHLSTADKNCVELDDGHKLCGTEDFVLENLKPTQNGARFDVDGVSVSLSTSAKADWLALDDAKAIVERVDGVYAKTVMGVAPDEVSVVGEDWLDGRAGKRFFTRVFVDNATDQTGGGLLVASMLHKAPDHVIRVSLKKQGLANASLLNGTLRKVLAGMTFGQ